MYGNPRQSWIVDYTCAVDSGFNYCILYLLSVELGFRITAFTGFRIRYAEFRNSEFRRQPSILDSISTEKFPRFRNPDDIKWDDILVYLFFFCSDFINLSNHLKMLLARHSLHN